MYFCEIENFAYGEINERSFSNPHPKSEDIVIGPTIFRRRIFTEIWMQRLLESVLLLLHSGIYESNSQSPTYDFKFILR